MLQEIGLLMTLVLVIIIILIPVIVTHKKNCMWYWDKIDNCYRARCGETLRIIGKDKTIPFKQCPKCEKPIAINPFIDKQEGKP